VDHFSATCRSAGQLDKCAKTDWVNDSALAVPIVPIRDLYGRLLFHSGRFRRLSRYHRLRAQECIAEIEASDPQTWFWRYLPPRLMLGDPAVRDAAIHGIQACIPQATLLPTGVDRITATPLRSSGPVFIHAQEQSRTQNTFTYDAAIINADGEVVEQWTGLRLRRVQDISSLASLPTPLLGPYLERRIQALVPEWRASIAVEDNHGEKSEDQTDQAISRAIGVPTRIVRSAAGKTEAAGGQWSVSASHSGDLLLAVAGRDVVSCDVEQVVPQPVDLWRDLLGSERFALAELITRQMHGSLDAAATHVWTASECLTKADTPPGAPLMLERCDTNGAVVFSCGTRKIATVEQSSEASVRVFAFLCEVNQSKCALTNTVTL
jgi:enediyne polyketide synthase